MVYDIHILARSKKGVQRGPTVAATIVDVFAATIVDVLNLMVDDNSLRVINARRFDSAIAFVNTCVWVC